MSALSELNDILSRHTVPVETGIFSNTPPDTYAVLTPLIDVMTSLLAIFMITAPLLTTGIPVDLPKGDGKTINSSEKTLDISVDAMGNIYLAEQKISKKDMLAKLKAIVRENPKIQIDPFPRSFPVN